MSHLSANDPEDAPRAEDSANVEPRDSVAPPRRIPHLGHALAFIGFTGVLLIVLELVLAALGKATGSVHGGVTTLLRPKLQIALLATTYLTTLLAAWLFFPQMWKRSFLDGIEWRWATARTQAGKLLALGLLVGMMMRVVARFITPPKTLPIDEFFLTPLDAWLHATLVAHLWTALLVLFSISLLLTWVRLKTESVAASALVHGAYNGFVFLMVMVQTGGYRHLERMTQ